MMSEVVNVIAFVMFSLCTDCKPLTVFISPHRLAKDLIQVTELKPEPWIAMGHFCNETNRKPRAVYFAQKVSKM